MGSSSPRGRLTAASVHVRPAAGLFLLVSALILALFASGPAALAAPAPEPAGRVTIVLGAVEATAPDGSVRTLSRQDPVFEGDTLRSGPRGRAQIRFTDRSLLSLRPDTEISIDDYEYDEAVPASGRQSLDLAGGGFRTLTGEVAERNRDAYRVSTPLAVVGVRGTIWDAFVTRNGALLLGVARGAISAESNSGRQIQLGVGSGFNYARVNPDGTIEFLIEPPAELASSPDLDEGEGGGGGGGGGGGTGGGSQESSVATGGGDAESTAGTVQVQGAQPVETVSNPESGTIAQSNTGTGTPPTDEPVPLEGVLTVAERDAFIAGAGAVVGAGVTSDDVDAGGEPIGETVGTGSGLGLLTSTGAPVVAVAEGANFPAGISSLTPDAALSGADQILTARSGTFESLFTNVGDVSGLTWGRFSAPITAFLDIANVGSTELLSDDVALLAFGTVADIADLTGTSRYQRLTSATTTSGFSVEELVSEVTVDFGAGTASGNIDVLLTDPTDTEGQIYAYLVDFSGLFEGGYLVDTSTSGSFVNLSTALTSAMSGEVAGFLTGTGGEALQLSFGFSTPAETDADVAGLILLRNDLVQPALLPEERSALFSATAVAAGAGLTLVDTDAGGAIEDPAGAGSGIATLLNGTDPLVAALPGTHFPAGLGSISRDTLIDEADGLFTPRSGTFSVFLEDAGGVAGLDWVEFSAPITLFLDASDETVVENSLDEFVLLAIGEPRGIADLTGTAFFESVLFDAGTSGAVVQDVFADLALDFDTGALDGILDVLLADPAAPAKPSSAYIVDFSGQLDSGVITSAAITFGEYVVLDTGTRVAASGDIAGFLTGASGDAFQLSFGYHNALDTNADVAGLVLLRSGIAPTERLLPEEVVALSTDEFGYVQALCCFGQGATSGVFKGRMTDPLDPDFVLANGGLSALDPAFNDLAPNNTIIRPADAGLLFFASADFGAGAQNSWFELQGFADADAPAGGPIRVVDSQSGALIREVTDELLILSGRPADVASLTGTARYELVQLVQGFAVTQGGGFASLTEPGLNADGTLAFNVDFASGDVFDGFLRLFTDTDDLALPPAQRDAVVAGFGGVVGLANDNPFMDLTVSGGSYFDADQDLGGDGIVDPAQSAITGMFAGDGSIANIAFSLVSAEDPELAGTNDSLFLEAANVVGNAVVGEADLSLSAAEQTQLQAGRVFVGVDCCGPDSGLGFGPSGDPRRIGGDLLATEGNFVLALNADGAGNDLGVGDAGVLDPNSVEFLLRPGDAFTFVDPSFTSSAPASADVVAGGWSANPAASAFVVDATTGELLEPLDQTVFFVTGFPSDIAPLQSVGFTTFAGSSDVFAGGIQTLGGFAQSNITLQDPAAFFSPGASVSFNVDLATGEVLNGHVFGLTEIDSITGEEFGFELFFDGQLQYANGNTFIDATLRDGVFDESVAIDFAASDFTLFIGGDPNDAVDPGLIALGGFNLKATTGEVLGGTFSIGNSLLPETRLDLTQAQSLNGGRLGLAAYQSIPFVAQDAFGAGGLLLGRANAPVNGDDFLLGANSLDLDPGSGLEVNTARRGFFEQPYDFVLTREPVTSTTLFVSDVVPTGGTSLAGFEVSWGIWDGVDFSNGAIIQDDAANAAVNVVIDRDVFFASVNPTPQSQLPVTGIFSYATAAMGVFGADFIGSGTGDLSFSFPSELPLTSLDASFELDFATGDISNGSLTTTYDPGSTSIIRWDATFDGFVNGAVTDLTLQSLSANEVDSFSGNVFNTLVGDLFESQISGVLTGPQGERFVGGFSLVAEDTFQGTFESVQGAFIMDRTGGL
jgi:hypothetical protein